MVVLAALYGITVYLVKWFAAEEKSWETAAGDAGKGCLTALAPFILAFVWNVCRSIWAQAQQAGRR